MVDKGNPPSRRDSRVEPHVDPEAPAGKTKAGAGSGLDRRAGSALERSPWRQWQSQPVDIDTSPPLEVSAPKRPQYGRYIYMLIIFAVAVYALRLIFTHVFWLDATGTVSGQQFKLSPSQTVKVESIMVEPAEEVAEGQPLVAFSSPQLEHELAQTLMAIAELEHNLASEGQRPGMPHSLDGLQSEIHALESEQQYLADHYRTLRDERVEPLQKLVDEGAIGRASLQEAERELREAMAEHQRVSAQLRGARTRLQKLQEAQSQEGKRDRMEALEQLRAGLESRREDMVLRAPSAGVIARVPVEPGETLSAGDETVELVHRQPLRSYLYFQPAASERLSVGQELPVTFPSGYSINTRVSNIYPSVQAVPEEALLPDSQADAASLVVAVEPVSDKAADVMRQLESGTPVRARVSRWPLPDLDEAVSTIATLFSGNEEAIHASAQTER